MYPLTHITVACGAVWAGDRLLRRLSRPPRSSPGTRAGIVANPRPAAVASAHRNRIDYRFVALGALLPDLIDKPLTWFLFPNAFNDDHIFGHALLLPLSLLLLGLFFARRGDARPFLVGAGALTHLLVDPVVLYPQTLFWPLLGLEFPDAKGILGKYQLWGDVAITLIVTALSLSEAHRVRWRRLLSTGAF